MADKEKKVTHSHGEQYWVRHQHDDVTVIQARERPDATAKDGERLIRVFGPYTDRALAEAQADKIFARTFAALRGEERR